MSLDFVVLTPEQPLATGESRAVLPQCVSRADAVFNLQRVALLLNSLQSGDYSLLRHALGDRVHQPARQRIVPALAEALELQHPDLLGVCLSGSGPSIVAIAERNHREIGRLLGSVYAAFAASATRFAPCKRITESTNEYRCSAQGCCVARAHLASRGVRIRARLPVVPKTAACSGLGLHATRQRPQARQGLKPSTQRKRSARLRGND